MMTVKLKVTNATLLQREVREKHVHMASPFLSYKVSCYLSNSSLLTQADVNQQHNYKKIVLPSQFITLFRTSTFPLTSLRRRSSN